MSRTLSSSLGLAACAATAALFLTADARAQGFNIDFNAPFGTNQATPSSGYAAAGSAGIWNGIYADTPGPHALVDKSGAATGVTVSQSASLTATLENNNAVMVGDDGALLHDIVFGGTSEFFTIAGLADGNYDIYTYAIAPDNKTGYLTDVGVVGSADPVQTVGGSSWTGSHAPGVSYAKHNVLVVGGASVQVNVSVSVSFISVNGMQIEPAGVTGSGYCFGDGSGTVCPCAAFGGAGEGCLTTSGTGATLSGSGSANVGVDSLVLSVSGAPANKPGLFFQGNNQISNPAGDGILCATGGVIRYAVNPTDAAGAVSQGGFGVNASAGQTKNYQYWFRDTGNSCGGGFNFTNGWTQVWN